LGRAQNDTFLIFAQKASIFQKASFHQREYTGGYKSTVSVTETAIAPLCTGAQHKRSAHMEVPPREQRARAAFFREKEARRVAKKQRKKDRLMAKVAQAAKSADVAPPPPHSYRSGK
jgi:hypothetical protein